MNANLTDLPTQGHVQVDGLSTWVVRSPGFPEPRSSTPVLMLHGWLRNHRVWRHLFDPMASLVPVLATDLPGFGRSDAPERATLDLQYYTRHLLALLDVLELPRVVILGHGLGGSAGIRLAIQQPDRVEAVVALSPSIWPNPQAGLRARLFTSTVGGRLWFERLLGPWQVRQILERRHFHDAHEISEDLVREVMADLDRPGHRRAAWRSLRTDMDGEIGDDIARMGRPLTLIWGYNDRIHPLDIGWKARDAVPGARLCLIPNCGHPSMETRPRSVAWHLCKALDLPLPDGIPDGHPAPV